MEIGMLEQGSNNNNKKTQQTKEAQQKLANR